jgi:hypothetical protein
MNSLKYALAAAENADELYVIGAMFADNDKYTDDEILDAQEARAIELGLEVVNE